MGASSSVGGQLWLGDVHRVMRTALQHASEVVGLITVTAPGADVLPWDAHARRVAEPQAGSWNKSAPKRWTEMNRRAQQHMRRKFGYETVLLNYAWQLQERGVLHMHLIVKFGDINERRATREYVKKLRELSPEFGFGFIDFRERDARNGQQKKSVMEGWKAANYISKYLALSNQLTRLINLKEKPARLFYVNRKLLAQSKCTMRRLRRVRFLYVIRRGDSTAILARAGWLPEWFRDVGELSILQQLLAGQLRV